MAKRKRAVKWPVSPKWNRRYGLLEEEGASEADEAVSQPQPLSESFYDDVHGSAKSLESLKRHSDFGKWLRKSSLTPSTLATVERRLQVYRDLRQLDPDSFWKILTEPSNVEGQLCTIWQHACHYIFNTLATALALLVIVIATNEQGLRWLALIFLAANLWAWTRASSLYGLWQSFWLEDAENGHRASPKTAVLANCCEAAYAVATLGLGGLVSLGMICLGSNRQGFSERIFNVRLVHEKKTGVELGSSITVSSPLPEVEPHSVSVAVDASQQSPERSTFSRKSRGRSSQSPRRRRS